jgi:aspartyl-tRNA(Asn)/glutamyl-tRNA(Gln) amidotransferase subunit A
VSGTELWQWEAGAIATAVRDKRLSSGEVLAAFVARIEVIDTQLHAFCTPTFEVAAEQAKAVDGALAAGRPVGPLGGVPVAVKDLICTAGIPTVGGSAAYADFVPDVDDVVVERVRAAGGLTIGKTNVSELGYGAVGFNPVFPTTRNPWDLRRSPGGSSAGSAVAVATGMSPVALGSDGGGSVRTPAAACGVVGVKASMGRVPLYPGCRDPRWPGFSSWESLEHIGPLARTVADAALLLAVISGPDPRDRHSIPNADVDWLAAGRGDGGAAKLRIGFSEDWGYAPVDPQVRVVVQAAAAVFAYDLGCEVEVLRAPWSDPEDIFSTLVAMDTDLSGMRRRVAEGARFGPAVRAVIDREWKAVEFTDAIAGRKAICNAMATLMDDYDLILTPTLAAPPPEADESGVPVIDGHPVGPRGWNAFTAVANMTGQPAVSLPAGLDDGGMPVGIQLIGRHLGDAPLLAAAARFEMARPARRCWE